MVRSLTAALVFGFILVFIGRAEAQGRRKGGSQDSGTGAQDGYREGRSAPRPINPTFRSTISLLASQGSGAQAHIRLSRSLMNDFRAEAPTSQNSQYAIEQPMKRNDRSTPVLLGTVVSLGFILTGLLLVRARPRHRLALPGLAVIVLFGAALAGCPLPQKTQQPVVNQWDVIQASPLRLNNSGLLEGEALLEVDDKATTTQVVVSRADLLALLQNAAPAK